MDGHRRLLCCLLQHELPRNRPHREQREGWDIGISVTHLVKSLTLAIWAAALSAVSVAHGSWSQYSYAGELISYQLSSSWQVQNERSLEEIGYLSAPYPAYTFIARLIQRR